MFETSPLTDLEPGKLASEPQESSYFHFATAEITSMHCHVQLYSGDQTQVLTLAGKALYQLSHLHRLPPPTPGKSQHL